MTGYWSRTALPAVSVSVLEAVMAADLASSSAPGRRLRPASSLRCRGSILPVGLVPAQIDLDLGASNASATSGVGRRPAGDRPG